MNKPLEESLGKPQSRDAVGGAPNKAPRRVHMEESRWEKIEQNLKTIGGAVLLALVIRTCLFEAFEIEGPSMEPTLLNGDRVVVAKFMYGLFLPLRDQADINWGGPNLGDVVIIKSPLDGVDIVKRVIGVAGDTIEVRDNIVYRNGVALPNIDKGPCVSGTGSREPHHRCRVYESKVGEKVFRVSAAHEAPDPMPTHVPDGHVYVLGDHRDSSNDSRNPGVGAIPVQRVKGRALSIYWSTGLKGMWGEGPEGFRSERMFQSVQ